MKQLAQIVGAFWRDEDGQDLLEYALLVALIALVAVAGVTAAGVKVERHLQRDRERDPAAGGGVRTLSAKAQAMGAATCAAPIRLSRRVTCDY